MSTKETAMDQDARFDYLRRAAAAVHVYDEAVALFGRITVENAREFVRWQEDRLRELVGPRHGGPRPAAP